MEPRADDLVRGPDPRPQRVGEEADDASVLDAAEVSADDIAALDRDGTIVPMGSEVAELDELNDDVFSTSDVTDPDDEMPMSLRSDIVASLSAGEGSEELDDQGLGTWANIDGSGD